MTPPRTLLCMHASMAPSPGSPRKLRSSTSVRAKGKKNISNSVSYRRPADQPVSQKTPNPAEEILELIANSSKGIWKTSDELKVVHLRGILKHYQVPKIANARRPSLVKRYNLLIDENTQSHLTSESVVFSLAPVNYNKQSTKKRKRAGSDINKDDSPLPKPRKKTRARPQVTSPHVSKGALPELTCEIRKPKSASESYRSSSNNTPSASTPKAPIIFNPSNHISPQTIDLNLQNDTISSDQNGKDIHLDPGSESNQDLDKTSTYDVGQLKSSTKSNQDHGNSSSDNVPLASTPKPSIISNCSSHISPQTTNPNLQNNKISSDQNERDGCLNPGSESDQDLDETTSDDFPLASTSRPLIMNDKTKHRENDNLTNNLPLACVPRSASTSNSFSQKNNNSTDNIHMSLLPIQSHDPTISNISPSAATSLPATSHHSETTTLSQTHDQRASQSETGAYKNVLLPPNSSDADMSNHGTVATNNGVFSHFEAFLSTPSLTVLGKRKRVADTSIISDVEKVSFQEMRAVLSSNGITHTFAHQKDEIAPKYLDLCSRYDETLLRKSRRLNNTWLSRSWTKVVAPGNVNTSEACIQGPETSTSQIQDVTPFVLPIKFPPRQSVDQSTDASTTRIQDVTPLVLPTQSPPRQPVNQTHPYTEPTHPIGRLNLQATEIGDLATDLKGCKRSRSPLVLQSHQQIHNTSSLLGLHVLIVFIASELTPSQLKEILDQHQISYDPNDRLARIINLYNELLSSMELETQHKVRRKQNQHVTRYPRPRRSTQKQSRPRNDTQSAETSAVVDSISPIYEAVQPFYPASTYIPSDDHRPPSHNDPLVFRNPTKFLNQNSDFHYQNPDPLDQYYPPDEDMTVDNNPQFTFASEDSHISNNRSFDQEYLAKNKHSAVHNLESPVDAAEKEEPLSGIVNSPLYIEHSPVANGDSSVHNQEDEQPCGNNQECHDGNEDSQPCGNNQECHDGNEDSSVDDHEYSVHSNDYSNSPSEEASFDEGSDFDQLADGNSEDEYATNLQESDPPNSVESPNPSQSPKDLAKSQEPGQSEISMAQDQAHQSAIKTSWTSGNLLTKAILKNILKEHHIPFKSRDDKQTLVKHYEQLVSSQDQAIGETQPSQSAELSSTACDYLTTEILPPCTPKSPQDLLPEAESNFNKFSPEELREMLHPFPLKTSSLSKKALVLLCKAHVIIDEPMKLRHGSQHSGTNCGSQHSGTDHGSQHSGTNRGSEHLGAGLGSQHSGTDAASDFNRQIPMEIDSCSLEIEEHRPTTAYASSPTDSDNMLPKPASNSFPQRNYVTTSQNTDILHRLDTLVELQTQTNHLLTIQATTSERHNKDLMLRIDSLAPQMDQIIGLAATNNDNETLTAALSSSRKSFAFEKTHTTTPGGRFAELIRTHVATLFGLRPGEQIPPPASEAERAQWMSQPTEEPYNTEDTSIQIDDFDDQHFPYPNGPGHADASLQTLKFIKREMNRFGISTFRPDLAKRWSDPDNAFLWNFAVKLFIDLVERYEYQGINLQMYGHHIITSRMKAHVKDTWQKTYRKNQLGTQTSEDLQSAAKRARGTTRVTKLRRVRCDTMVHITDLKGLIPIVEKCCSEDESDDQSDAMSIDSDVSSSECESEVMRIDNSVIPGRRSSIRTPKKARFSNSNPKCCIVHKFIWRNPEVDNLMNLIDKWRLQKSQSTPKKRRGPIPAIRRRPAFPIIIDTEPSSGLPYDFYDPEWLRTLSDVRMASLNASPKPALEFYASILRKYLSSQK
ncbi:hypothetical protein MJO29_016486 [Puccinia striiformis f. sp. tritici]|nr:hypothetical protein MJO29_016486 [Puccinia striiformis f. sp. tritici]